MKFSCRVTEDGAKSAFKYFTWKSGVKFQLSLDACFLHAEVFCVKIQICTVGQQRFFALLKNSHWRSISYDTILLLMTTGHMFNFMLSIAWNLSFAVYKSYLMLYITWRHFTHACMHTQTKSTKRDFNQFLTWATNISKKLKYLRKQAYQQTPNTLSDC